MSDYDIVIGLGKTGYSCVRYLRAQGQSVIAFDTRLDAPLLALCRRNFPEVTVYLGTIPTEVLTAARRIILSPGLAIHESFLAPARESNIPVIGDIEIFAENVSAPIVGITGTNAKSTVTSLLGEMAKGSGFSTQVGGNLGFPVLDMLDGPTADLYILELSSFQLETTYSLRLKSATILNISPDHLDRYTSLQEYISAKQRIYWQTENAIINRDDALTKPATSTSAKKWSFGLNVPNGEEELGLIQEADNYYLARGARKLMNCNELKVQGKHNWANALAALALGYSVGLPEEGMFKVLRQFTGLTHRGQWVASKDDINFYNDSKGTNIGASVAALEGLAQTCRGKVILIAGGQGKKQNFAEMRSAVANYTRAVILLGVDAPLLQAAWQDATPLHPVKTMLEAVQLAKSLAEPGDAVLLSPACASFDMFTNYEHRGEVFMQIVRSLC